MQREAAKCVACGLCLPRCPTYTLLRDEAESPRGRLSLMLALARGDLPLSGKLESHLARCLGCRACEKVCPSYVAFGQAIDAARTFIEASRATATPPLSRAVTLLHWLVKSPVRIQRLGKLLVLYQRSGIQRLLRTSRTLRLLGLAELDANLPALEAQKPFAKIHPAPKASRGEVALFTGCVARVTERQTLFASIRLLNHLGYNVRIPPDQGCCGALHLHHGRSEEAVELMRRNIAAFSDGIDAIVSTASGCAATLCEYGKYLENAESATQFSRRVVDISQFVAGIEWPSHVSLRPLAKRIAVHDPCTLTNVLRQEDRPYALLARIPGAEAIPLAENRLCCGAAGTYHLTQTPIAKRLREAKLAHLKRLAPDMLVTSNAGCAMFLAAGFRETGLAMEVIHPIVLIERQLQVTSSK